MSEDSARSRPLLRDPVVPLLTSLVISPRWADVSDVVANGGWHRHVAHRSGASDAFPGVRIAPRGDRLVTLAAGWWARYSIGHARRMQPAGTNPGPAGAGAT